MQFKQLLAELNLIITDKELKKDIIDEVEFIKTLSCKDSQQYRLDNLKKDVQCLLDSHDQKSKCAIAFSKIKL